MGRANILLVPGIILLAFSCSEKTANVINPCLKYSCIQGAIVRGDTTKRSLTLVFTGDEFADGEVHIRKVLKNQNVKAAFFFTGNFYRNIAFKTTVEALRNDGHYLGAHSDKHLLYCDWDKRDSLLVTKVEFTKDLNDNYAEIEKFGISKKDAPFFMPPYEWYNDFISNWTSEMGLQLINFTSGTRSNADYTTPEMPNYIDTSTIYKSIIDYETNNPNGLNGFILLIHIGTAPERTDKFYLRLETLISTLRAKNYQFLSLPDLLSME
ncbi:MAG: polysaccharide deacetylase family protein [Bacteroidetes bacterium]|nr:polysaccharide deacetylase family protein [Bacteroidota bacterium]